MSECRPSESLVHHEVLRFEGCSLRQLNLEWPGGGAADGSLDLQTRIGQIRQLCRGQGGVDLGELSQFESLPERPPPKRVGVDPEMGEPIEVFSALHASFYAGRLGWSFHYHPFKIHADTVHQQTVENAEAIMAAAEFYRQTVDYTLQHFAPEPQSKPLLSRVEQLASRLITEPAETVKALQKWQDYLVDEPLPGTDPKKLNY